VIALCGAVLRMQPQKCLASWNVIQILSILEISMSFNFGSPNTGLVSVAHSLPATIFQSQYCLHILPHRNRNVGNTQQTDDDIHQKTLDPQCSTGRLLD
jgi:hypothetical protein